MEKETIDLVRKCNLRAIDKIEIRGENFDKEVKGKVFIITEKPKIERIIKDLKIVEKSFLCDCKPRFRILFYKQTQLMIDMGFQNYEDHYYLRYDNEEQFIPIKESIDFLNKLIEEKDSRR